MSELFIPAFEPEREALVIQRVQNGGILVSVVQKLVLPGPEARRSCAFSSNTDLIKAMLESDPQSKDEIRQYLA